MEIEQAGATFKVDYFVCYGCMYDFQLNNHILFLTLIFLPKVSVIFQSFLTSEINQRSIYMFFRIFCTNDIFIFLD